MDNETRQKIETLLLEQFPRFQGMLGQYQWPHEQARWHELIFCILSAHGQEVFAPPLHRDVAREAVELLAALDLLKIEALKDMIVPGGALDENDTLTLLRAAVLERLGYPAQTVDTILVTLAEMARHFCDRFDGKVQKYLRRAGERMLGEMSADLAVSSMLQERATYVFTHWLQNTLNMPIGLHNPSLLLLCQSLGVTPEELMQIADEADLNLALLDDMAVDFVERSLGRPTASDEAA